ncbi:hypothetical protein HLH34_04505 [Gluconacetobacter azotocaptans]|uniref:Uncharacterized protein n=1 Tax=Gluconacetobacter azotocaptans TaxID=142834 RepID=A0A7W4PD18_9PROT|nr:hypothetical protein [Gluconacetobacter azotocaptans]MBB2189225.1 hypothetical protein [Gluconacetobacter azotocaptans]GBQ32317.1 hypothetical protein AA13594_2334 [Gluconacetobacter azotocaptans DSM 13594]
MPQDLAPKGDAERVRLLEDRVLVLETSLSALDGKHEDLKSMVDRKITELTTFVTSRLDAVSRQIGDVNDKLARLFGARAVVTGLITLVTSILGSGVVHVVVSLTGGNSP